MLGSALIAMAFQSSEAYPPSDLNLVLSAPISTWDEAIPLGNGLMGGLLWGEGNTIRLSLDRGDLWDERPAVEPEWWKQKTYAKGVKLIRKGDFGTVNEWWDGPYNGVTPTKLPAGRLEIAWPEGAIVKQFELKLAQAEGVAYFDGETKLNTFFSAKEPVSMVQISGSKPKEFHLIPSGAKKEAGDAGPSSGGAVAALGYPPATLRQEGNAKWFVQKTAGELVYCVCAESKQVGDKTLIAVAVTSTNDGEDPLALARERVSKALNEGYERMLKPHQAWWRKFWSQSRVVLPKGEEAIAKQYMLVQYFHGAASRRGAPPMPLQGVWTADNGGLPPWKGDYHNDLNTQMTYMAYQGAGHFEEGLSYLDYLWDRRSTFRAFARDFYGTKGLACPGVMSLAGQPLGGWGQYSMSPTMSAWSAHLFYLHWLYTGSSSYLRTRAYPWCSEVGECMLGLLKPDKDGRLVLPLSSSPEINDNSPSAWFKPNTNYDLMSLKMLFLSLQEMATALGRTKEADKWAAAANGLGDYHVDKDQKLLIDATTSLPYSHRHLSNIMGLFPFNLITCEGGPTDQQRIKTSLAEWDAKGTGAWCGYSFSWMSCLRARVGDADAAIKNLDIYCKAFILRNGFHANGDQTRSGYSGFTYRPFTLEGNFLAAQAVHEMLLQSWSTTPGKHDTGIIRLFPACPARWQDVSFDDLRAEGGHMVSARRVAGKTVWFKVVAGKDGEIRIKDSFGLLDPVFNRGGLRRTTGLYHFKAKKGDILIGELR